MAEIQDVFAINVRKYRKSAHLSQEKLAELAGLHRTYIGGIEQKRVNISIKNVAKIASALDVDPAVLFLSDCLVESQEANTRKRPFSRMRAATERDDYALISWKDDRVSIRPIDVANEDLTVQILYMLIRDGFEGEDLSSRYEKTSEEVLAFLKRNQEL